MSHFYINRQRVLHIMLKRRTLEDGFFINNMNNWIKASLIQDAVANCGTNISNINVLDLGSGKGDSGKWNLIGVHSYVGIDIDPLHVAEARERFSQMRVNKIQSARFEIMGYDDIDCDTLLGYNGNKPYDIITCFFSLHYGFKSESRLYRIFECLERCLKPSGMFVAVTTDTKSIIRQLWKSPSLAIGNPLYMAVADPSNTYSSIYNNQLTFHLQNSKTFNEYFVGEQELIKRLRALGRVKSLNSVEYAASCLGHTERAATARNMQAFETKDGRAINRDEFEVVSLYRVYMMKKN